MNRDSSFSFICSHIRGAWKAPSTTSPPNPKDGLPRVPKWPVGFGQQIQKLISVLVFQGLTECSSLALGWCQSPPICQQTKSWAPAFGQERTTPSGLTENRSSVDSGSILALPCPWQSCRPSFQGSLCPHSSARPGTPNPSAHPRPEGQAAAEPPRLHTLPQGCHAPLTGKSR